MVGDFGSEERMVGGGISGGREAPPAVERSGVQVALVGPIDGSSDGGPKLAGTES